MQSRGVAGAREKGEGAAPALHYYLDSIAPD
jgi:hypothetical protein